MNCGPIVSAAVALLLSGWGATADVRQPLQDVIAEICGSDILSSSAVGLLAMTADGDTVAAVNPELKLVPASNVKLITTGLALRTLGEDFRFETRLGYDGEVRDGVLYGDLYIIGGADPTTGSRAPVAEPLDALFSDWAALLASAGIERIEGRIVGDARFFDDPTPENLGWSYDDLGTNYGAGPTGLNFFENAQNFLITPGAAPGDKPVIRPRYPETPWMKYSVTAVTGGPRTANTIYYVNTPLAALGEFGGSFPCDRKGYTYEGSNRFGAYTCAWHFLKYLESEGVEVSGGCADISAGGFLRPDPGFGDSGIPAAPAGELEVIGGTLSTSDDRKFLPGRQERRRCRGHARLHGTVGRRPLPARRRKRAFAQELCLRRLFRRFPAPYDAGTVVRDISAVASRSGEPRDAGIQVLRRERRVPQAHPYQERFDERHPVLQRLHSAVGSGRGRNDSLFAPDQQCHRFRVVGQSARRQDHSRARRRELKF